jgi:PleD family two-component response regulator
MRASKMFHSYEELKLQKIEEIEEENGQDFILIVNENQLEARMMGSYLANFGYKFKDVSNGFEALNIIKTTPPLLVISSIKIGNSIAF